MDEIHTNITIEYALKINQERPEKLVDMQNKIQKSNPEVQGAISVADRIYLTDDPKTQESNFLKRRMWIPKRRG